MRHSVGREVGQDQAPNTEMEEMVARDCLPLTRHLQIRGFLMYVVCTYSWINPYMKGLHLTIDSW